MGWKRLGIIVLAAGMLAGCGSPVKSNSGVPGVSLSGRARGGQQPISGAQLALYSYDYTTGYTSQLTLPAYTDIFGNFSITGDYTCPSSTAPMFLAATGGNPGLTLGTNNTASSLFAYIGLCGSLAPTTFITLDEVTTVAFASQESALESAMTQADVTAAVADMTNIANSATGLSPGVGQSAQTSGGAVPVQLVNTLADITASCVNSNGSTASGMPCYDLFSLANTDGTPTNTLEALQEIFDAPYTNVTAIYDLAPATGPFQPTLTSPPSSFTVTLMYVGAGLLTASPDAGTVGDTIVITSNNPSVTATDCPFSQTEGVSFGGVPASGSFTATSIMATVPYDAPSGNVGGVVYTVPGYCTFAFFVQDVSAYTVSPSTIAFGNQATGTTSAPHTVTFTNQNASGGTVQVGAVVVPGADQSSFPISADTCTGNTIAYGASCTVKVAFDPAATGSASGSLTFYVNGSAVTQVAALSGTGS